MAKGLLASCQGRWDYTPDHVTDLLKKHSCESTVKRCQQGLHSRDGALSWNKGSPKAVGSLRQENWACNTHQAHTEPPSFPLTSSLYPGTALGPKTDTSPLQWECPRTHAPGCHEGTRVCPPPRPLRGLCSAPKHHGHPHYEAQELTFWQSRQNPHQQDQRPQPSPGLRLST